MKDAWNPDQYERFRDERRQPFFDLLALVQRRPGIRVLDLGCGTGVLTRTLHRGLLADETLGIDNSEAMLAKSMEFAGSGVCFRLDDLAQLKPDRPYDLVFSNAALHWVPDHQALLGHLTAMLGDGGQIAVQVPANHDHASHTVAAEVASEEPFTSALGGYRFTSPVLPPEAYATCLHQLGYERQHVRLQVYTHRLDSAAEVVEWTKGTLLTTYERRLSSALWEQFVERYRQLLLAALDDSRPYLFTFKRILLWGERP